MTSPVCASGNNGKIVLVDDPLLAEDCEFLEQIIKKSEGKRYLNAVQYCSIGGNFGVPTDDASQPVNTYLPGGVIIRKRYSVSEIVERYNALKNSG